MILPSDRESEVHQRLVNGEDILAIAKDLNLSPGTIRQYESLYMVKTKYCQEGLNDPDNICHIKNLKNKDMLAFCRLTQTESITKMKEMILSGEIFDKMLQRPDCGDSTLFKMISALGLNVEDLINISIDSQCTSDNKSNHVCICTLKIHNYKEYYFTFIKDCRLDGDPRYRIYWLTDDYCPINNKTVKQLTLQKINKESLG